MTFSERLRAALAEATPGPWMAHDYEGNLEAESISSVEDGPVLMAGRMDMNDAYLIVLLRNHAERIAAAFEAAAEMTYCECRVTPDDVDCNDCGGCLLRDKLAALNAEVGR